MELFAKLPFGPQCWRQFPHVFHQPKCIDVPELQVCAALHMFFLRAGRLCKQSDAGGKAGHGDSTYPPSSR